MGNSQDKIRTVKIQTYKKRKTKSFLAPRNQSTQHSKVSANVAQEDKAPHQVRSWMWQFLAYGTSFGSDEMQEWGGHWFFLWSFREMLNQADLCIMWQGSCCGQTMRTYQVKLWMWILSYRRDPKILERTEQWEICQGELHKGSGISHRRTANLEVWGHISS